MKNKYYTWRQFTADSKKLSKKIDRRFDCLVGISRGGIFLAGILARLLDNRRVYLVSYNGGGQGGRIKKIINIHQDLKNKKVLLIDDLSDKGKTLWRVKSDLEKLGNKVAVATLHCKAGTVLVPDYFISWESDWIVYPWEIE